MGVATRRSKPAIALRSSDASQRLSRAPERQDARIRVEKRASEQQRAIVRGACSRPPISLPPDFMPGAPSPPRFFEVFEWRLLCAVGLMVLLAVMGIEPVNRAAERAFLPRNPVPNPAEWKAGTQHVVDITLLTKDAERLACASSQEFGGSRCQFSAKKRRLGRRPGQAVDENQRHIIQPYRTAVGNYLLLAAGLWDTPALAFRRHREPPRAVAENKLQRFIARCELEFLGRLEQVEVQWTPGKDWYTEKNAPVARAIDCRIVK